MTTPDSTPTTPEQEIPAIKDRVAWLESRVASPHVKGGLVRTHKGMENSHRRITALEQTLNGRLDVLQLALEAATTGGKKSFLTTLRKNGIKDDSLANVLMIIRTDDTELDLTDEDLFGELYTSFQSLQAQVDDHQNRLTAIDATLRGDDDNPGLVRTVNEHTEQICDLASVVSHQGTITTQVVENNSRASKALVPSLIIGLIAALLWHAHHWTDQGNLFVNGKIIGTSNYSNPHNTWWAAFFFGALIAGLVYLVVSSLIRGRTTTSTTQSSNNRSSGFWHGQRRSTTQQTAPVQPAPEPAAPADAPAPTQQLEPVQH